MDTEIIKDSISKGGLRVTTIETVMTKDEFVLLLNDPDLTYSIGRGSDHRSQTYSVLMTSGSWHSVIKRWRSTGSSLVDTVDTLLFKSVPEVLLYGYWHLPFITEEDAKSAMYLTLKNRDILGVESPEAALVESVRLLTRVSTARCARIWHPRYDVISPLEAFAMELDYYADMEDENFPQLGIYQEHVQCVDYISDDAKHWLNPNLHGKFKGWITYRLVAPVESWHANAA